MSMNTAMPAPSATPPLPHRQGDVERQLHFQVSPFMDRLNHKTDFAKGQMSFMNYIVIPGRPSPPLWAASWRRELQQGVRSIPTVPQPGGRCDKAGVPEIRMPQFEPTLLPNCGEEPLPQCSAIRGQVSSQACQVSG